MGRRNWKTLDNKYLPKIDNRKNIGLWPQLKALNWDIFNKYLGLRCHNIASMKNSNQKLDFKKNEKLNGTL